MKGTQNKTAEELRDILRTTGFMILDIAQHLALAQHAKPEYMPELVERGAKMAYDLAFIDWDTMDTSWNVSITTIGDGVSSTYSKSEDISND